MQFQYLAFTQKHELVMQKKHAVELSKKMYSCFIGGVQIFLIEKKTVEQARLRVLLYAITQGVRLFLGPSSHEIHRFQDSRHLLEQNQTVEHKLILWIKLFSRNLLKAEEHRKNQRQLTEVFLHGVWVWSQHDAQVVSPVKKIK